MSPQVLGIPLVFPQIQCLPQTLSVPQASSVLLSQVPLSPSYGQLKELGFRLGGVGTHL